MANSLKTYPNAIFEAWNEPNGASTSIITPGYMTYLTTMYNAIRQYRIYQLNLYAMELRLGAERLDRLYNVGSNHITSAIEPQPI